MGVSVTHSAMQETIILEDRQNTSNIASDINKVTSKYLSGELPLGAALWLSDQTVLHHPLSFFFFFVIFTYDCTGSLLLSIGFSLVVGRRGYPSLWCLDFLLWWLLLLQSMDSRA